MRQIDFEIKGNAFSGYELDLPGAPLVVATGKKGFVMCGYLNMETAEKLHVAAALVRGVKTVDDLRHAVVQAASAEALKLGIHVGSTGDDALSLLA